jgi:carboxymethylenebutenolidase
MELTSIQYCPDSMQLTGGIGRARLSKFYLDHFIFNNPDDTALELISRTVGIDRVVDEFVFCFTHDKQIDWLWVSLSLSPGLH